MEVSEQGKSKSIQFTLIIIALITKLNVFNGAAPGQGFELIDAPLQSFNLDLHFGYSHSAVRFERFEVVDDARYFRGHGLSELAFLPIRLQLAASRPQFFPTHCLGFSSSSPSSSSSSSS